MESLTYQEEIDQKNQSFWNELCGTHLAKELGIYDSSIKSLKKFDDFYFNYYPYLKKYLCLDEIKSKNVLEIGLGYGTVSQLLAESGAHYHGLDIAPNAQAMVNHRLKQQNLIGDVRIGSMLECPFTDNSFDYVISIGCFHHTGNMQACVDEAYRVLKKGGKAIIMVYNQFSLRQWSLWPTTTLKILLSQWKSDRTKNTNEQQRQAYDASHTNEGAPETEFFSQYEIKKIFKNFQTINITRENFDDEFKLNIAKHPLIHFGKREKYLNNHWSRLAGLDLYITATK
jgi:ubiquinone/menaquinone biosynthesis C-methylase UbiE